jgi:hypothetical protein
MAITDDLSRPLVNHLPRGVVIEPKAFLILWADNDPAQGSMHLNFKLSRDGETIGLYDTEMSQWVDLVFIEPLPGDQAYGRRMDGQDEWGVIEEPSPGTSNGQ